MGRRHKNKVLQICSPGFDAAGFKMYAVGVGNAVEDELKEIASEPTAEHYFYTADFKTMTQIAKKLQINICQGRPAFLTTHTRHRPRFFLF